MDAYLVYLELSPNPNVKQILLTNRLLGTSLLKRLKQK